MQPSPAFNPFNEEIIKYAIKESVAEQIPAIIDMLQLGLTRNGRKGVDSEVNSSNPPVTSTHKMEVTHQIQRPRGDSKQLRSQSS